MSRVVALSLIFCCLSVTAAPAVERCNQPYAPEIPNGRTATREEITTARSDARAFIAASDVYQQCLSQLPMGHQRQLDENQHDKERVAAAANAATAAFNEAHAGQVQLSSR